MSTENRSEGRAQKLEEMQRQMDKEKRTKSVVLAAITLVIVALGGLGVFMALKSDPGVVRSGDMVPTNATAYGSFRFGANGAVAPDTSAPEGAVRAELFFDPMCPGCAAVERAAGGFLSEGAKSGELDLYMTPLSFLDSQSTDKYSTRAVNSLITVIEESPEHALEYISELYTEENHPEEGPAYEPVTNEDFARMATNVGVPAEVSVLFAENRYFDWIMENTEKQAQRSEVFPKGLTTPTMVVGGTENDGKLTGYEHVTFGQGGAVEAIEKAIEKVKQK